MAGGEYLLHIVGIASIITVVSLAIVLVLKMDKLRQYQAIIENLKRSLDEMDEQAKLIVRTDMELNKTQEELDKKIKIRWFWVEDEEQHCPTNLC